MRNFVLGVLAALMLPNLAGADPVSGDAARKMLYGPRGFEVEMVANSGLVETQRDYIEKLVTTREFKGAIGYYGALALSPSYFDRLATEGAAAGLSGLLQITTKLHSPEAAEKVAVDACSAARMAGDAPCRLVALMKPRKWTAQTVTLSSDATAAFKVYRKDKGDKAFAVSASTVAYAIAKGEGAAEAALAACNEAAAKTGSPDCEVLIAD